MPLVDLNKRKEYRRKYYLRTIEQHKERSKAYYKAHRAENNARSLSWHKANPSYLAGIKRRWRVELHDIYIKDRITKNTGLPTADITPPMVIAYREVLISQRILCQMKGGNKCLIYRHTKKIH